MSARVATLISAIECATGRCMIVTRTTTQKKEDEVEEDEEEDKEEEDTASTSKGKQSMQPKVRTKSSSFRPHKPQMPTGCSRKDPSQPTVLFGKEMVFSPDDKARILTAFSAYMDDCITDPKKQVKKSDILPNLQLAGPPFRYLAVSYTVDQLYNKVRHHIRAERKKHQV